MPHVHNGIGTWYYGKKRIHRLKGTCEFCNRVGELTSYDTTLYIVIFMVPVIPLSHKRVLSDCPYCRRHRVMSLKEWETGKAKAIADLLAQLEQDPDNRDAILSGLNLAMWYQDEELFNKLATGLAEDRRDDAAIQAQLAAGYSYFARYPEAETAYRAALAVENTPALQRQLAWVLLKQGRPEEAFPYLQSILENKEEDGAGMIFLLVEALQAQGQHRQALELMNVRDEAFQTLAQTKEYKKQRRTSERYQDSGKKIAPVYLGESTKVGYKEGGKLASWPKFVLPILIIGLLAWYLGAAVWIGRARQVYLVNGWDQPYTVAVNGEQHSIHPGTAKAVQVPEGEVAIEYPDPRLKLEPVSCRIETNFFARPFASHTFIINPDRLAILKEEKTVYAEVPQPVLDPPRYHYGLGPHDLKGIDYEFVPFPHQLTVSKGSTLTKTRVGVEVPATAEARLLMIPADRQEDYVKQWLRLDLDNAVILAWAHKHLRPAEALGLVEPNLVARPLRVENHRLYQHLMDKNHPGRDLRPDYEKLVAETRRQPDALYLLARLMDGDESDNLLKEAASAAKPSSRALRSLGFRSMASGHFDDAVRWLEQANQVAPKDAQIKRDFWVARLAVGKHDQLLQELGPRPGMPMDQVNMLYAQFEVYAARGDKAKAQSVLNALIQAIPGLDLTSQQAFKAQLDMMLCCGTKDVDGWLKLSAQVPSGSAFEPALLRGKLHDAADLVDRKNDENTMVQHGLLYLAARQVIDQKLADEQWSALLAALARGTRHERQLGDMLAGRRPMTSEALRRLPIEPKQKRVLLLVALKKQPDLEKEMLPLARQLDFQPDAISLCLRKVLGEPKPATKERGNS